MVLPRALFPLARDFDPLPLVGSASLRVPVGGLALSASVEVAGVVPALPVLGFGFVGVQPDDLAPNVLWLVVLAEGGAVAVRPVLLVQGFGVAAEVLLAAWDSGDEDPTVPSAIAVRIVGSCGL